jgi:PAS domain S-box-containing protein
MDPSNPATVAGADPLLSDEMTRLRAELETTRAQLREANASLALRNRAINATTSGITIVDATQPGYPIVYLNDSMAQRSGYRPEELIGQSSAFMFEGANPQAVSHVWTAMQKGEEVKVESPLRRKDGQEYWIGMSLSPVRDDDGRLTHYVAFSADITRRIESERKRAELQVKLEHEMQERERMALELKLSQKLESVGRLAAGIAHEINTPIQFVSDSAHFLRSSVEDLDKLLVIYHEQMRAMSHSERGSRALEQVLAAEQTLDLSFIREEMPRAFDRLLEGVERVTRIVRAMKEFAHPDMDEQSPADLNHALETTLMVAHNEYKYLARVETKFSELPPVRCNIGELNQVFLNMIVNAAHAIGSAQRGEDGLIVVRTALDPDGHARIEFVDNGCGITPENLDKIYDPFFTTKEVGKGTGQGLAISRSIVVDRHGGTIEVNSTVGEGTRFTLRLPVAGATQRKVDENNTVRG